MAIDPQKYNTFFQGLTLDQRQGVIRDKLAPDAVMAKYGSQPTQPTQPATMTSTQTNKPSSYEDQGKALIQSQFDQTQKDATDLGLGPTFSSIDEQLQATIKRQREQKAQQEQQLQLQQKNNTAQTIQASNVANAATATQQGQLTGSREGMFSATNQMGVNKLGTALKERTDRIMQAQSSAQAEVQKAQSDLAYAEQTNNTQLAQKYRKTLDQATMAAKQIDTEYMKTLQEGQGQALDIVKTLKDGGALSGLSQEDIASLEQSLPDAPPGVIKALSAAATKASMSDSAKQQLELKTKGLDSLTSLFSQGTKMEIKDVSAIATSLGLPMDMAVGAYNSFAAIRDDKTLSTQDKMLANAKVKNDLNLQLQGIYTEAGKNAQTLATMYKNGASPEIIAAFKSAANITDQDDPKYQADLKLKQLDNAVKQYEVSNLGKPPEEGTKEWLEYKKAQLDYQIAEAENADILSQPPETALKDAFYQAGPSDYGHPEGERECGEGFNDITVGKKVGDSYASKMSIVTKRNSPQIGNALVIPNGGTVSGHIETVLKFNPITQTVQTVSWNHYGDGKQTIETYTLDDLNKKYGNNWGFSDNKLKPEYEAKLLGVKEKFQNSGKEAAQVAQDIMKPYSTMTIKDLPPDQRAGVEQELNKIRETAFKNNDILGIAKSSAGGKDLDTTTLGKLEKTDMVIGQLQDLTDVLAEEKTGPILGVLRSNNSYDDKAVQIKALIQGLVPSLARGVYGEVGVLTDQDINNYIKTLPNLSSTEEQKKLLLDMTKKTLARTLESTIKNQARGGRDVSGFAPLFIDDAENKDSAQPSTFTELLDKNTPEDFSTHTNFNRY